MKHRAVWIFLLGVLVGIALSILYKHFVTDRIMDRGGMENPDFAYPLDGDRTYVDNSALWPVLEGTWKSTDGRWQAVIGEESGIVLTADGETVLESPLHFTYAEWIIDPGTLDCDDLIRIDGYYENGEDGYHYEIYLRPWGTYWDDVDEGTHPYSYDDWYLPLIKAGKPMPDSIGADAR